MSINQKIRYSKRSPNLLSLLNQKIYMNQKNADNDDMLAINKIRNDNKRKHLAILNRTDVVLPQTNLEIISSFRITKLFEELNESLDTFINSGGDSVLKRKEEVKIIGNYNSLVTYIKTFARSYNISTDDKLSIIRQFKPLIPKFKQMYSSKDFSRFTTKIKETYNKIIKTIEDEIYDNVYISADDFMTETEEKKYVKKLQDDSDKDNRDKKTALDKLAKEKKDEADRLQKLQDQDIMDKAIQVALGKKDARKKAKKDADDRAKQDILDEAERIKKAAADKIIQDAQDETDRLAKEAADKVKQVEEDRIAANKVIQTELSALLKKRKEDAKVEDAKAKADFKAKMIKRIIPAKIKPVKK